MFDFDICEYFWSSRFGISIIALNTISFKGESCSYSFINLKISSTNFLSAFPDGSKKDFSSKTLIFRKLKIGVFQNPNHFTFPIYISRIVRLSSIVTEFWLDASTFNTSWAYLEYLRVLFLVWHVLMLTEALICVKTSIKIATYMWIFSCIFRCIRHYLNS